MSGVATAIVGSAVVGAVGTSMASRNASKAQQSAAESGAAAQTYAAEISVEEQRRQFDEAKKVLAPYVQAGIPALQSLVPYEQAGAPALQQQQALIGLSGPQAQQAAIRQIEQSPQMQAMLRQGEEAILSRASATGGLRGGNTQAALAQFRPQLLSSLIDQQYARLGGMTALGQQTSQNIAQLGQASAAGQATAGLQTAANVGDLLTGAGRAQAAGFNQAGAAQAGQALATGQAIANVPGQVMQGFGTYYGLTGQNPFAGSQTSPLQGYYPQTSAYTNMTDFEGGVAEGLF